MNFSEKEAPLTFSYLGTPQLPVIKTCCSPLGKLLPEEVPYFKLRGIIFVSLYSNAILAMGLFVRSFEDILIKNCLLPD